MLLFHLIDPIYRVNINKLINENKKLLHIKPLEVYGEVHKVFQNKQFSFKDIEKFVKDNASKFKADKTYGLLKLCVKEIALIRIQTALKAYKRIRMEKLSNMLEIEKSLLLSYLKIFTNVSISSYIRKMKYVWNTTK